MPIDLTWRAGQVVELRLTYAAIPDELAGRMPLAYVQLVQILSDLLIFFTPFALLSSVGGPPGYDRMRATWQLPEPPSYVPLLPVILWQVGAPSPAPR